MTTFKEIRGTAIQSVSSDPTNPEAGQIWYNNTIGVLKGYQLVADAWAAGGNLNTSRWELGSAGTQTAAVGFGGFTTPPFVKSSATEKYDGTSWTNSGSLNTARGSLAGAGTQTAALGFGGYKAGDAPPNQSKNSNATESYNGSTWTSVNNMNTTRLALSGTGTQTAALGFGGYTDPPAGGNRTSTESWNGTSWTTVNSMNTARQQMGQAGTQTAALAFGGNAPPTYTTVESWNGTSWTTSPVTLNTGRYGLSGCGTQTTAIAFGGYTGTANTGATELYNGSTWTNTNSMSTARRIMGEAGTQTLALGFGGYITAQVNTTEEFTGAFLSAKKITTS